LLFWIFTYILGSTSTGARHTAEKVTRLVEISL